MSLARNTNVFPLGEGEALSGSPRFGHESVADNVVPDAVPFVLYTKRLFPITAVHTNER
jgi:hypothetical protein